VELHRFWEWESYSYVGRQPQARRGVTDPSPRVKFQVKASYVQQRKREILTTHVLPTSRDNSPTQKFLFKDNTSLLVNNTPSAVRGPLCTGFPF
jgi:hypothetical protein